VPGAALTCKFCRATTNVPVAKLAAGHFRCAKCLAIASISRTQRKSLIIKAERGRKLPPG
jgi:hypothetical protein